MGTTTKLMLAVVTAAAVVMGGAWIARIMVSGIPPQ